MFAKAWQNVARTERFCVTEPDMQRERQTGSQRERSGGGVSSVLQGLCITLFNFVLWLESLVGVQEGLGESLRVRSSGERKGHPRGWVMDGGRETEWAGEWMDSQLMGDGWSDGWVADG